MPYRRGGATRARSGNALALFNTRRSGNNFKNEGTSIRRHNRSVNIASGATAIASTVFLHVQCLKFRRSFGGGADDEPTPTASNNFASSDVMNGSNVYNHQTSVKIQNEGTEPHYLNIYQVATSFADVAYTRQVYDTIFPFTMTTTGIQSGRIEPDTPTGLFDDTVWRNFMGLQRQVKKIGTINLGTHDSGDRGVAELNFTGVPPKCRKSQTGMYYGYIISNDTILNNGAAFNGNIIQQTNFDEIPSSNRLPYQW